MRGRGKKALLRKKFDSFSFTSIVSGFVVVLTFIIVFTTLLKAFSELLNLVSSLLNVLSPAVASWSFVSKHTYYIIVLPVSTTVAAYIAWQVCRRLFPKRIIRDKNYILELFSKRDHSGPAPTRRILYEKIYGKGRIEKNVRELIFQSVDKNIDKIKTFIDEKEKEESILCINSKWGSGKTTSLLIAINESRSRDNRYIYEATFKYNGDIDEYINDVLSTLKDSLMESGVKVYGVFNPLIENLDSDTKRTIINIIKDSRSTNTLSSDLVLRLNSIYERTNVENRKKYIIVIDDLDRLQGAEIVRVLSLLSVMKNLRFVRIIVPADLDVVCKALDEYGVVDSSRYVEKYLPFARSLGIDSGYGLTEKVLTEKLLSEQKGWNEGSDGVYPAIAAIFIGMLAKKMRDETRDFVRIRYRWLCQNNSQVKNSIGDVNEQLSQLLDAPVVLANRSQGGEGVYGWDNYNNITRFQNILYALNWSKSGNSMPYSIRRLFTNDDYLAVVDSWIFEYMEKRWDLFGFTIRDALDILKSVDYRELSKISAEQFVQIFNQLFPKEQLTFDRSGDRGKISK